MSSSLMANYGRPQLEFEHGKGSFLYTVDGQAYLDFAQGIAVNCLGHCHPALVRALQQQSERLWHCSNLYRIGPTEKLAGMLTALTFADRVFFSNSGTEAVEAGFKIMRRYHHDNGQAARKRIIAMSQSFHGRTLAPVAASANPVHTEGFLSGDSAFDQVPFGDIDALAASITHESAGIILEPVQGEGGIRVAPRDYLQAVRELCDAHGILLMFDEVQCGSGRSGYLFAYQALGVTPDLLVAAKGLGGGFPIGACLSTEAVAAPMVAGTHGSTFGGNPLATAVATAVIEQVSDPAFLLQVRQRSDQLQAGLHQVLERYPSIISDISGMGLMIGLRCKVSNTDLLQALTERHMLAVKAGANSIRLLPPLNVTEQEVNQALDIIDRSCQALKG